MYKTILVPIDLSHPDQGRAILKTARKIGGDGSRLVALYVTADIPGYVAAELPMGTLKRTEEKAAADLKAVAASARAETMVRTGHAPTVIIETAESIGADLIVIASHRPGLQDYFLGSTAARVVRHSDCSVLVER